MFLALVFFIHFDQVLATAHRGPGPMGAEAPATWPTPSEAKTMLMPSKDSPVPVSAGVARNESNMEESNNSNMAVSEGDNNQHLGMRVLRSGSTRETDSAKK